MTEPEDTQTYANDSATSSSINTELAQPRSPTVRRHPDHSIKGAWGHTYFVRSGSMIKIGHSAIPKTRISSLQSGFPEPLDIMAVIPNTIIDEPAAHKKFAHLRVRGEWFRAEDDLIEFIAAVKTEAHGLPRRKKMPLNREMHAMRRHLIARRVSMGADTVMGHRCSTLIAQIENYSRAQDDEQRAMLAKLIRKSSDSLASILEQGQPQCWPITYRPSRT